MLPVIDSGRTRDRTTALRSLLISTSALTAVALLAVGPGRAQTAPPPVQVAQNQGTLPPVHIEAPRKKPPAGKKTAGRTTAVAAPPSAAEGPSSGQALAGVAPTTPLNTNVIAGSATRLGLTAFQTPASVEVVSARTMQEQGYRTSAEIGKGAVGVLDIDSSGAPASFSMRGFTFGAVNILYNGISIGVSSDTSRVMDLAGLAQVEFLKGPSALMSGLNAIGGSVNYVNRLPSAGPVQIELDASVDSLGTFRSHFGSGGSTAVQGLDYRFDAVGSSFGSAIDDTYRNLTDLATQFNYHVNNTLMTFVAVDYKKDSGHAYWGTPVVPTSFAGANAVHGVVSGTAISTFSTDNMGPVTIDGRTLTNNYNVADNATGAQELWLRSGFEWTPLNNVTVKDQVYYYQAKRNWIDSETYAFGDADSGPNCSAGTICRDRFFVTHDQHVAGNNVDFLWDSRLFGMDNRFAAQFQVSGNWIKFTQADDTGNPEIYPYDAVPVVSPSQGLYGAPLFADIRNKQLTDVAAAFEDRLKITSQFALIGGVRLDDWTLKSNGINSDGSIPDGQPFSQTWRPVSYRAAYTYEPTPNLMFYSMYATSYDPAAANVFSVNATTPLALTSAQIYETGVKQLFWDDRAEWTFAAYDITRRNVYVPLSDTVSGLAGEIRTKGYELAGGVRPFDGWKLWGNVAWTHDRYAVFNA